MYAIRKMHAIGLILCSIVFYGLVLDKTLIFPAFRANAISNQVGNSNFGIDGRLPDFYINRVGAMLSLCSLSYWFIPVHM